jgi:hypothetical protein
MHRISTDRPLDRRVPHPGRAKPNRQSFLDEPFHPCATYRLEPAIPQGRSMRAGSSLWCEVRVIGMQARLGVRGRTTLIQPLRRIQRGRPRFLDDLRARNDVGLGRDRLLGRRRYRLRNLSNGITVLKQHRPVRMHRAMFCFCSIAAGDYQPDRDRLVRLRRGRL